jgi:hypothetical protein
VWTKLINTTIITKILHKNIKTIKSDENHKLLQYKR